MPLPLFSYSAHQADLVSNRIIVLASPPGRGCDTLTRHLRRLGWRVRTTSRWPGLLKTIERFHPQACILDAQSGPMPVIEALRVVKKIYPRTQILVLGPKDYDFQETVHQEGGEYLLRTLPGKELGFLVARLVERHRVYQEYVRLQSQVISNAAYLAHVLNHLEEAILTTDLQGVVLAMNRAAQQLLNQPPRALVGQTLAGIALIGDGLGSLKDAVERTLTQHSYEGRFLLSLPNLSPLPVYLRGTVYTEEGEARGTVMLLRDLTQQEELAVKLEETERLAALAQIAAGMAHEIRNPLTSAGGFVHRVDRLLPPEHPAKAYIPVILGNIRRMENMVREIDDYLLHINTSALQLEDLRPEAVIFPALTRLQQESDLSPIDLRLEPWPEVKIRGDRQSLAELFFNLLHNAVEAMPRGGTLHLRVRPEERHAVFQISDTGPGIPPEHLHNIYQPFFTTKLSGAGMGLTKVYMIAERHRGQVEVQSRPGHGTTIIVRLPLAS